MALCLIKTLTLPAMSLSPKKGTVSLWSSESYERYRRCKMAQSAQQKGTAFFTYNPVEVELPFPVSHWIKRHSIFQASPKEDLVAWLAWLLLLLKECLTNIDHDP